MQVEIVSRGTRLKELHDSWSALWARCAAATPFQSPAWLIPWWQVFEPGHLCTIAVWDGSDLAALAPLYIENDGNGRRRGLPLGVGCSDCCDILVPDEEDDLRDMLGEAVARLGLLSIEFPDLGPKASALHMRAPCGFERTTLSGEPRPAIDINGGDLLAAVPPTQRRKLRMARHRAERAGGLRIEPIGFANTGDFIERLGVLHERRWALRGEAGVLADPRTKAFHADAVSMLQNAGLLRAALAWIGNTVAGAYYGLGTASAGYAYLGGFDPTFAEASPGTILLGWAIEEAARCGATTFDLLRGRETYKYRWGAIDRPSYLLRFQVHDGR